MDSESTQPQEMQTTLVSLHENVEEKDIVEEVNEEINGKRKLDQIIETTEDEHAPDAKKKKIEEEAEDEQAHTNEEEEIQNEPVEEETGNGLSSLSSLVESVQNEEKPMQFDEEDEDKEEEETATSNIVTDAEGSYQEHIRNSNMEFEYMMDNQNNDSVPVDSSADVQSSETTHMRYDAEEEYQPNDEENEVSAQTGGEGNETKDGEDNREMYDDDQQRESESKFDEMQGGGKKKNRSKEGRGEDISSSLAQKKDETAEKIITKMKRSAMRDKELYEKKQMATERLKIIKEVRTICTKPAMFQYLVERNLLEVLAMWITPFKDGTFPNNDIRTVVLEILSSIPFSNEVAQRSNSRRLSDSTTAFEGLDDSQIYATSIIQRVQALAYNQSETQRNKRSARRFLERYNRLVHNISTSYKDREIPTRAPSSPMEHSYYNDNIDGEQLQTDPDYMEQHTRNRSSRKKRTSSPDKDTPTTPTYYGRMRYPQTSSLDFKYKTVLKNKQQVMQESKMLYGSNEYSQKQKDILKQLKGKGRKK